jgi:hypothetical protein
MECTVDCDTYKLCEELAGDSKRRAMKNLTR